MIYEFKFPDVGEGLHEGKILKLNFTPKDKIREGDILAEIETDKVVAEIPSSKNGVLEKYGVSEGQIIKVGEVLAYIQIEQETSHKKEEEEVGAVVGNIEGPQEGAILPSSGEGVLDKSPESIEISKQKNKVLATPLARKIASDNNIDITKIKGNGPGGRILKIDILKAIESSIIQTEKKLLQPQKEDMPEHVSELSMNKIDAPGHTSGKNLQVLKKQEFSQLRKTIARNMEQSHQIPAFIMNDYVVIDKFIELRDKINKNRETEISFLPFLMKALAGSIKKYTFINSHYNAQEYQLVTFNNINIGFAVDTPEGLVVPVVKNVPGKSILEIDEEIRTLAQLAKTRKIKLEDTKEGTITITNYGPFGGIAGSPLIMPPQIAILGFGRIEKKPVVQTNNIITAASVLPISLVADHRAIDGAPAGRFLTYFKHLLNSIEEMMINI